MDEELITEFLGGPMDGQTVPVQDDWPEYAPLLMPIFNTMGTEVINIDVYERVDRRGKQYSFVRKFVPWSTDEFEVELEWFPDEEN